MISSLELAKLCGVSQGTVDRALHGRAGISSATRQRVLKIAEKYGYTPNPDVKELMSRKSTLVGAALPARGGVFFSDLLNAVREELAQRGLRLWMAMAGSDDEFVEMVIEFCRRRCHGLVLVPPVDRLELPAKLLGKIPAVSLIGRCEVKDATVTLVAPDETKSGTLAAGYLAGRGHTNILHVRYTRDSIAINDRARGYEDAMASRGLMPVVVGWRDEENLVAAVKKHRPTALFCHNDWLALSASRALRKAGYVVPDDISILGVDDSSTFTALCPEFTTLAYPMAEVASCCGRILSGESCVATVGTFRVVERHTVRSV